VSLASLEHQKDSKIKRKINKGKK